MMDNMNMMKEMTNEELYAVDGGFVITTTTLVICAVSSFCLGGLFGAGVYVGYREAGK